jgi:hypothetical protein
MHPEDLMKPDLFQRSRVAGWRRADIRFTVADRSDCAHPSLTVCPSFRRTLDMSGRAATWSPSRYCGRPMRDTEWGQRPRAFPGPGE